MTESSPIRPNVSTDVTSPSGPERQPDGGSAALRPSRSRGGTYLTQTPSGWRFQIRVPKALVGCHPSSQTSHVGIRIGPIAIGRARTLADAMATICRTVFERAEIEMAKRVDDTWLPDTPQGDLTARVIAACEAGLAEAKRSKDASIAIGFASGLKKSLDTLTYVHSEMMAGAAGNTVVRENADAIVTGALRDVLALGGDLGPVPQKAGILPEAKAPASPRPTPSTQTDSAEQASVPLFSEASREYIDMRVEAAGDSLKGQTSLELRRRTFLEVIGDRRINEYKRGDLQRYVNAMQYWPANVTKRADWAGLTTPEILARNRSSDGTPVERPSARKIMQDGYVSNVKTMMSYGAEQAEIASPFQGVRIRWPAILRPSVPREPISHDVISKAFEIAINGGKVEDALLLLLSFLCGRRVGLLAHLTGNDLRQKDGVWVASTDGVVKTESGYARIPIKTDGATFSFVLHHTLHDVGFCEWATKRKDEFVFSGLQNLVDPSKSASKNLNRLLREAGAKGGNREVLHSLRGDRIDENRDEVSARANRLQAGHELTDVHDNSYGLKAIRKREMVKLYRAPLPDDIDLSPFGRIDFSKLELKPRIRRRRKGPSLSDS